MKKKEFLEHWSNIESDQDINPLPVAYKHKGSTFDQDSIRITGSMEFIDSVLSRIKTYLRFENGSTRLGVSMTEATDRDSGSKLGTYKCYIQVHERGPQAQMMNAFTGRK